MYTVTQDYLQQMRADRRRVDAKVVIDYTDPSRDASVTVTVSERAPVSYPEQSADSRTDPTHKWASLDGSWLLDGTYHLAPTPDVLSLYQFGWWSAQLAGADGRFASPYPTLTVTHAALRVPTLRVIGDSARGEWPVDFNVSLYSQDGTLLHTESVTGNATIAWSRTLPVPVLDVVKQVLTITRWSHPGRQAKILEFFTSIQETYYGGNVVEIRLLEEREASQGSLPVGNISANEVAIRLANEGRKFDVTNTHSPLWGLLKPNRRIRAWLGVKGEGDGQSLTHVTTTQADWSSGTLSGVQATAAGDLELAPNPALSFDGVDDYVQIAADGFGKFNYQSFTIEAWVYVPTLTNYIIIWSYDYTSHVAPYYAQHLRIDGNGAVFFGFNIAGVFKSTATPASTATAGAWHHVAAVFTSGKQEIYITGMLKASGAETGSITYYNQPVWVGRANFGYTKACILDEIRIWNKARTQAEIQADMHRRLTGTEPGLVGYWRLDEGSGTVANDATANANHGTISGATWTTSGTRRVQSGSRTSPVLDLSPVGIAAGSSISWTATTPAGTSVTVETSLSLDGGATWGPWQQATNGGQIPGITAGTDLSNARLQTRVTLSTTDTTVTPQVHDLTVQVNHEEWVPLGTFWSLDWDSPDDALEAQVRARDRLELLRKSTYQPGQVQQNISLYTLAEQVLQDAGLQPGEYWIDPALQQTVIPWAWLSPTSHREALRVIAEAALAVVYADRDGVVRIEAMGSASAAPVLEITADDYFPPLQAPSRQDQVANEIVVTTQPLKPAATAQEVYRSTTPVTVPAGQTVTVTVQYTQAPVIEAAASLDSPPAGVNIAAAAYYAWGAEVTIQNTSASQASVTVVVTGKPLSVQGGEQVIARDETSITENGVLRYELPANPLVQMLAQAQAIAQTLLASAKDPRRDIEVEWRGNPALELGDRVTVVGQDVHVIRQEITWAGALSARLTGRKVA